MGNNIPDKIHADESQSGLNNIRIQLVGMDRPFFVCMSILLSIGFAIFSWCMHESDMAMTREDADFNAKVYNREVAIDADLIANGIDAQKRYGPIPVPPRIAKKE